MNQHLNKKTPEQMVEAIFALDLDPIKFKLMDKTEGHGWSRAKVDAVELEYRRFLALTAKYPEQAIAPNTDVDKFWHGHILDTMKYAEDCEHVFGYFLHHFPYFGMRDEEDAANLANAAINTRKLYEKEFGAAAGKDGATAYCGAAAAYCGAAAETKEAAAFCSAPESRQAAFCSAPEGKKADAAYCGVVTAKGRPTLEQATAYCGAAAGKQADTAYCGAAKTSYCGAAVDKQTAYCGAAASKQADTAYCGAAQTAYCGAAAKAETAYCGVAAGKQADSAYCGATQAAFCSATPDKKEAAAYCGAAATAYCGVVTGKGRPKLEPAQTA